GKLTPLDSTGSWQVIGPGGGGGIFLSTISPFDPDIMLARCDMTGAYITYDGGTSWRMINFWNSVTDFEFDPIDPNTIYVSTMGSLYGEDRGIGMSTLFRSEDQGERWRIIYPEVKNAIPLDRLQNQDLPPSQIVPGTPDASIDIIAVDPIDNQRIYLGVSSLVEYIGGGGGTGDPAQLLISTDRGNSWELSAALPGNKVKGIFPGNMLNRQDELLVFTDEGCVRVDLISGQTTVVSLPVPTVVEVAGGQDTNGAVLYILSPFTVDYGGVYRSTDWGESWTPVYNGLFEGVVAGKAPQLRALAVCEKNPRVLYLASSLSSSAQTTWRYGIFKTDNSGNKWNAVWLANNQDYITNNYEQGWLDDNPGWGGKPIELGVAPSDPNICFGGDNGRGYGTTDGGETWKQVYSHVNPDNSATSSGLDVTTCYGVHFDPFDREHIMISYTDIGLFHSYNGGQSWYHAVTGIPNDWINTCYWLEFDPEVEGRAWSVWANAHDLPRDKMLSNISWFKGGVAVTDDGGQTWRSSSSGLPTNAAITDIQIDLSNPASNRTLYVTVFGRGVYKSTDGGASWFRFNDGITDNFFAWHIRRATEGKLYLVMCRSLSNGQTVDGKLFARNDGQPNPDTQWELVPLPQGVNAPHDILIDPRDSRKIYLSCWARQVDGHDTGGGLFRSDDGGQNWTQVFDERVRVNSAALDPLNPNTVYINTFQNAAYRSDNGGESWNRLEGYRFKWGQRVIPDVNNPGMIYLTTLGGSVYYGPAQGVPGAFEDIENMPSQWW
ncbi:WD40/YVTN/BNR-like repeat-containing protein, partial [Gemmatimonadota bacterium]